MNATAEQKREHISLKEQDRRRGLARKQMVCAELMKKFSESLWQERLLKIANGDVSFVAKALNSFVATLANDEGIEQKDTGGLRKYIADCSISSIAQAFLLSFQMGLEVGGGRDHCHLVNYDNQCDLEVSYKGFAYALHKHFDNAFLIADCIFEGDLFECEVTDNSATYKFKPANAFNRDVAKFLGVFCYFSYTIANGEKVSRLVRVAKADVEMAKSKAKGSWAWKDFYFEMALKVAYRRASKIPFASIDFSDDEINPEVVDNKHYQLAAPAGGSGNLQALIQAQRELIHDIKQEDSQKENRADVSVDGGSVAESEPKQGVDVIPQESQLAEPVVAQDDVDYTAEAAGADDSQGEGASVDLYGGSDDEVPGTVDDISEPRPTDEEGQGVEPEGWDGKTIYTDKGKATQKEFDGSGQAIAYLRRLIAQRKTKASRVMLIEVNSALIDAAVATDGDIVRTMLDRLASHGE